METGTTEKEKGVIPAERDQQGDNPDWFQDFVDKYDYDKPQRGEILKGVILDVGDNSLLLDVGLKRDAIVTSQDLDKVDKDILADLETGDEVFVSVIRTPIGDDDLLVSLSRGIAYESWVKAKEYMANDEMIELEIIDQNKGGLLVEFDNLRGFVPNSHIPSLRRGTSRQKANEEKAKMIGDMLPVKVIEVNRKQRRLVFSARVAQKEKREKRLKELEEGDVIKSRVVNVVDFGVFVDLDGVDGLVHKSEIAWDRVYDPSKYFDVGDEIEVKVVDVDVERERVSLSRKALLPNPWEELEEKYEVGDLVEGKVVSVLDFGAFVELPEGLQGLVHVSEIGYANMGDPESVVQEGDKVLVRILSIEPERERVSLSMRRVPVEEQMEWMMEEEDSPSGLDPEALQEKVEGETAVPEGEVEDAVDEGEEGAAAETTGEDLEPEAVDQAVAAAGEPDDDAEAEVDAGADTVGEGDEVEGEAETAGEEREDADQAEAAVDQPDDDAEAEADAGADTVGEGDEVEGEAETAGEEREGADQAEATVDDRDDDVAAEVDAGAKTAGEEPQGSESDDGEGVASAPEGREEGKGEDQPHSQDDGEEEQEPG